jgi:hypothetical protein
MADIKGTIHRPLDRRDSSVSVGPKPGPMNDLVAALEVGQSCESPDPRKELSFRIRERFPDRKFKQKKTATGYTVTRVK